MKGAPAKPISGTRSPRQLAAQPAQDLEDERNGLARVARAQALDLGERADRLGHHGTRLEVDLDAQPGTGTKMSEKKITASVPTRRSGWSDTSTARSTSRHSSRKESCFAHAAVLGQVAAGLAHQPDGRPVDRLAPAGAQQPLGRVERGRGHQ